MVKAYRLPPFTIVVDTNALYPKDVVNVVGPKFLETWKECSALTQLRLVIPEVVRGERLYQLLSVAQQASESAAKSLERISKVSGCRTPKPPSLSDLRKGVEQRFDEWVKHIQATTAPIPYNKISWPRIVNDAMWRVKPFAAPVEDKDSEKGFRDSLILESLAELVQITADQQLVFISKDSLLREAAVARFAATQFAAYEDLSAFSSYLKLAAEEANQSFAQAVLQKVPQVFYTPNDPTCVYNTFDVGSRILKQFPECLNFFFEKPQPNLGLAGLAASGSYVPVSEDKVFIDSTEFISTPGDASWYWKTRVRFVRLFRKHFGQPTTVQIFEWLNETVRIQQFDILWTATIDADARFSNLALTKIQAAEQTAEPGWLNKHKYGFSDPPPPQTPQ